MALNKFKRWFGIEGVKVEALLDEPLQLDSGMIDGTLRFTSMHTQTVREVHVKLVERYARGRGADRLVDDYVLGEITLIRPFTVPAEEEVKVQFKLPYQQLESEIDRMGSRNLLLSGVARLAKMSRRVRSTYRLEIKAKVEGTTLHPFERVPVVFS